MNQEKDFKRNRTSDEGRDNDPELRDESAIQPGTSTISKSNTDNANQQVTKSALDGREQTGFDTDTNADPAFDDIGTDEEA
jgi:hypothetical protein